MSDGYNTGIRKVGVRLSSIISIVVTFLHSLYYRKRFYTAA